VAWRDVQRRPACIDLNTWPANVEGGEI